MYWYAGLVPVSKCSSMDALLFCHASTELTFESQRQLSGDVGVRVLPAIRRHPLSEAARHSNVGNTSTSAHRNQTMEPLIGSTSFGVDDFHQSAQTPVQNV
jgi:hypothetical protein